MAVFDGIGKTLGKAAQKASQGLSDAAQGVKNASKNLGENIAKTKEKSSEDTGKCPNCGATLNGITVICPQCGHELRSVKASTSISGLSKEIEKIERKRNVITDSLAAKIAGKKEHPTDERIASLIRNFVVPNTKEDIFEFMILAAGNMDAKLLAGRKNVEGISELIVNAWNDKFEQTYQKARITFGNDRDFKKIEDVYEAKMQEIEKERPLFSFGRRK